MDSNFISVMFKVDFFWLIQYQKYSVTGAAWEAADASFICFLAVIRHFKAIFLKFQLSLKTSRVTVPYPEVSLQNLFLT